MYQEFIKFILNPSNFLLLSAKTLNKGLMLSFTIFVMSFILIFSVPLFIKVENLSQDLAWLSSNIGLNLLVVYIFAFIFLGNFREFLILKQAEKIDKTLN